MAAQSLLGKGVNAMNTIWLKVAVVAVAIVVILIVGSRFLAEKPESGPSPGARQTTDGAKTVYDSFERDDREFGVDGQSAEEPAAEETAPPTAQTTEPEESAPVEQAAPAQVAEPTFEKLPIEEEVQAQKLHSMALEERKRSRLPMMTPKLMVDYCRQIIQRWPTSEYAFQAKRMLADIPDRYKKMYDVTDQETDVSNFYK